MPKKYDYSGWSKEDLIKRVHELEKRKKYGLVWDEEREPEKVVLRCKKELPVLKEVKEKEIKNDPDKPTHILIEGDNYHALSVLNYTHENSVDVIYIDPPYNTGAKDWKYNNNYVDENDAYRHSKWLNFMNNRLKISKNLLTNDGVLICTIDHNELNTLGLLLKDIFPDKEITCITIVHNPSGIQGKNFSHNNEYAYFVHAPNKKVIATEVRSEEDADVRQFMNTAKGNTNNYLRESGKDCFYPIYVQDDNIIGFGDVCASDFHPSGSNITRPDGTIEIYPIDSEGTERKWVFARKSVESIIDELSVKYNSKRQTYEIIRTKKNINYKTVWVDSKLNAKSYGTELLKNILKKEFPFPKSLYAVMQCISAVIHKKEKSIILDFFAGSGTTGHAVLEMNKNDGGNRQFILVTNNENGIAEEICFPRIKHVIEGYDFSGTTKNVLYEEKLNIRKLKKIDSILEKYETIKREQKERYDEIKSEFKDNTIRLIGLNKNQTRMKGLGGNLKYYKTDFVPAESTDLNKEKLTKQSVEMLCLRENTFEPVLEDGPIKIFQNKEKYTAILFD